MIDRNEVFRGKIVTAMRRMQDEAMEPGAVPSEVIERALKKIADIRKWWCAEAGREPGA